LATSYPKAGRPTNWDAVRQAAALVEEARAAGLPADILRLSDRGYLRPGSVADVVVL
jgi:alpha-D-ribose 1-methylphosphonate 5-triphosphate diphosphatase PhnM